SDLTQHEAPFVATSSILNRDGDLAVASIAVRLDDLLTRDLGAARLRQRREIVAIAQGRIVRKQDLAPGREIAAGLPVLAELAALEEPEVADGVYRSVAA